MSKLNLRQRKRRSYSDKSYAKLRKEFMSCIENEIILENLYEKYLDLGYDKDMASELAFEEFANLQ